MNCIDKVLTEKNVKEFKKIPTFDNLLKENQKLKEQQKEFIEYLEKNINHYKEIIKLDRENNTEQDCKRFEIRWTTYEEILSKYKEITGGKE